MHMQPMYRMHEFITPQGSARAKTNAYIAGGVADVGTARMTYSQENTTSARTAQTISSSRLMYPS